MTTTTTTPESERRPPPPDRYRVGHEVRRPLSPEFVEQADGSLRADVRSDGALAVIVEREQKPGGWYLVRVVAAMHGVEVADHCGYLDLPEARVRPPEAVQMASTMLLRLSTCAVYAAIVAADQGPPHDRTLDRILTGARMKIDDYRRGER